MLHQMDLWSDLIQLSYILVLKRLAMLKIQKGKTALVIPEHISEDLDLAVRLKTKPVMV